MSINDLDNYIAQSSSAWLEGTVSADGRMYIDTTITRPANQYTKVVGFFVQYDPENTTPRHVLFADAIYRKSTEGDYMFTIQLKNYHTQEVAYKVKLWVSFAKNV